MICTHNNTYSSHNEFHFEILPYLLQPQYLSYKKGSPAKNTSWISCDILHIFLDQAIWTECSYVSFFKPYQVVFEICNSRNVVIRFKPGNCKIMEDGWHGCWLLPVACNTSKARGVLRQTEKYPTAVSSEWLLRYNVLTVWSPFWSIRSATCGDCQWITVFRTQHSRWLIEVYNPDTHQENCKNIHSQCENMHGPTYFYNQRWEVRSLNHSFFHNTNLKDKILK